MLKIDYTCQRSTALAPRRHGQLKKIGNNDFGLIIAFLLPGFIFLWALSLSYPQVASWLINSPATTPHAIPRPPSVGGFLYSTLASLALGLILSALRWLVIDHALVLTGVKDPGLNFSKLTEENKAAAFRDIVENHYRYYQYYSNTFVAMAAGCVTYLLGGGPVNRLMCTIVALVALVLLVGARDALKKYFDRAHTILS